MSQSSLLSKLTLFAVREKEKISSVGAVRSVPCHAIFFPMIVFCFEKPGFGIQRIMIKNKIKIKNKTRQLGKGIEI